MTNTETIAEIRERDKTLSGEFPLSQKQAAQVIEDRAKLLRIVDEQSAEIERLTKERDEAIARAAQCFRDLLKAEGR